jgi:hypothetical protein
VRLVMSRAGGLGGSIVFPGVASAHWGERPISVKISGPPARGDDLDFDSKTGLGTLDVRNGAFGSRKLPPGTARIMFFHAARKEPIHVVDGVEITAGEVNRDPRLQKVDLGKLFAFRAVKVVDEAGRPVREAKVLVQGEEAGSWISTSVGADGAAQVAVVGEAPEVVVKADGFEGARLGRLDGDRTVTLKKSKVIRVKLKLGAAFADPAEHLYVSVNVWPKSPPDAGSGPFDVLLAAAKGDPAEEAAVKARVAAAGTARENDPLKPDIKAVRYIRARGATVVVAQPGPYDVNLTVVDQSKGGWNWIGFESAGSFEVPAGVTETEATLTPDPVRWSKLARGEKAAPDEDEDG